MVVSSLIYGSEVWTIRQDKNRLTAAEMQFLRKTTIYTLFDHNRNEEIIYELKKEKYQLFKKITKQKSNWIQHVSR